MNHLELWTRTIQSLELTMPNKMVFLTHLVGNSFTNMDVRLRSYNKCSSKQEQVLLRMPPQLSLECKSLITNMKQGLLRQSKVTLNGPLLRPQSRTVCMTTQSSRIVTKVVNLLLVIRKSGFAMSMMLSMV